MTFSVKIANQGDNPEQDVRVRVRITGAGDPIRAEQVVDQTQPKTETTVAVKLDKAGADRQAGHDPRRGPAGPRRGARPTNNALSFPAIFRRS